MVGPFADEPSLPMSTVSLPLRSLADMLSPTVVKVVTDARGNALYFSRSPIPFVRDGGPADARSAAERAIALGLARKHVGLYAYRRTRSCASRRCRGRRWKMARGSSSCAPSAPA